MSDSLLERLREAAQQGDKLADDALERIEGMYESHSLKTDQLEDDGFEKDKRINELEGTVNTVDLHNEIVVLVDRITELEAAAIYFYSRAVGAISEEGMLNLNEECKKHRAVIERIKKVDPPV